VQRLADIGVIDEEAERQGAVSQVTHCIVFSLLALRRLRVDDKAATIRRRIARIRPQSQGSWPVLQILAVRARPDCPQEATVELATRKSAVALL